MRPLYSSGSLANTVIEDKILSITAKTKMPILFTILFFFIFTPFRLQGYYIFLISFTFFIRAGLVSKISPL